MGWTALALLTVTLTIMARTIRRSHAVQAPAKAKPVAVRMHLSRSFSGAPEDRSAALLADCSIGDDAKSEDVPPPPPPRPLRQDRRNKQPKKLSAGSLLEAKLANRLKARKAPRKERPQGSLNQVPPSPTLGVSVPGLVIQNSYLLLDEKQDKSKDGDEKKKAIPSLSNQSVSPYRRCFTTVFRVFILILIFVVSLALAFSSSVIQVYVTADVLLSDRTRQLIGFGNAIFHIFSFSVVLPNALSQLSKRMVNINRFHGYSERSFALGVGVVTLINVVGNVVAPSLASLLGNDS